MWCDWWDLRKAMCHVSGACLSVEHHRCKGAGQRCSFFHPLPRGLRFLFFRLLSAPRQLFWFFWLREPPFGHIRRLGLQTMILSFEIWISSYFFMKFPSKHFETGVFPDGLADTFLCCFVLQVELRIERPGQILKAQSLGVNLSAIFWYEKNTAQVELKPEAKSIKPGGSVEIEAPTSARVKDS